MVAEYETRSKYLTLALAARRVVDLLLPFVERGERATALPESLKSLVESLESGGSAESLLERLRTSVHRPIFEELLTGNDLDSSEERTLLAQELRRVVEESCDIESQRVSAKQAIRLLCAVEGRALSQFNQLTERYEPLSRAV